MKSWVTYAFREMRLEEVASPRPRPGWAIVRTRVVQPYGEKIPEAIEITGNKPKYGALNPAQVRFS